MFGLNEITGKRFFQNAPASSLFVASRFFTLQGEGPFRGQPAYFIRLAKCNLACSFCDTYFDSGVWQSFDTLLQEAGTVIDGFFINKGMSSPSWARDLPRKMVLVITGGEPALQSQVADFLAQAQPYFYATQIESNGTVLLNDLPLNTTLVVSPKCFEKNGEVKGYLKPNLLVLERANCLKFVLCAPNDARFEPYSEIPQWAHAWADSTGKPVFISPMNIYKKEPHRVEKVRRQKDTLTLAQRSDVNEVVSFWEPDLLDLAQNQKNHEYAAEYCLKYGFTLNLQIHLFASLP